MRPAAEQAGSLVQLLRDLAAEGVIVLAWDAGGVAPHGVGGFEVLDREAFQRRRMMWFQREEPGTAVGSCGKAGGFRCAEQGGAGVGSGTEREKESSANQAFRRNGLIPERKAGTRGYDWENGRFWSFDVETFRKYGSSSKLRRRVVASGRHGELDIPAANQEYSPQAGAKHMSQHMDPGRQKFFNQKGSSAGGGLIGNSDSGHQSSNLFIHSDGIIAPWTQTLNSELQHTQQGRVSHPSFQPAQQDPAFGGIFNSVMTSPAFTAEAWLQQQQMHQMHQPEIYSLPPAAPSLFWAEMLSCPPSEPLQASMQGLRTAPVCSSVTDVEPFSITPFSSAGLGFTAGSPEFRNLLEPEPVLASICQSTAGQQHLSYQQQGTGDVFSLPSCISSTSTASTHQPATSQLGSIFSMETGAGDISQISRPLRPTPRRPMSVSGSFPHSSNLHKESKAFCQPHCWDHYTICEVVQIQQLNTQDCFAAQPAFFLPEDENDGSHITVGSLLNP